MRWRIAVVARLSVHTTYNTILTPVRLSHRITP
jgi:hypothetical protein